MLPSSTKLVIAVIVIFVLVMLQRQQRKPATLIEHLTRVATDSDRQESTRAFLKMKCEAKGHEWAATPDGTSWDCYYTEATCKANSAWPEVTAEDDPQGVSRMYQYWNNADGKCYLGYGAFRKKCESLGLRWEDDTQRCRVTPQYCKDKLLMYKDGDCHQEEIGWLNEKIFGKTLGRAMSMAGISGAIRAANWSDNNVL